MFVAIHELAHVMTKSIGHGEDFWNNMRFLLLVAIKTDCKQNLNSKCDNHGHYQSYIAENKNKIYKYVDYASKSAEYCGTQITTTPCNKKDCTK